MAMRMILVVHIILITHGAMNIFTMILVQPFARHGIQLTKQWLKVAVLQQAVRLMSNNTIFTMLILRRMIGKRHLMAIQLILLHQIQ